MRVTRRSLPWWLLAVAVLAVAVVVAGVLVAREPAAPHARGGSLVLPVIPVGGDLPEGRQTLDGALADVEDAVRYGAGGIRVTADLRWLCETPQCDTAPLEPVVERARELGLRVYVHVNSTPTWLDGRGRWYAPEGEDAQAWAGLFAQLVERFGTEVSGYEVWNEPNYRPFWRQGPDAGQYADLLKAVWEAVEPVDPDARIIGGVLSNNDLGYMGELSQALAERGGNRENRYFYDVLGVHPYAGARGEGFDPQLPPGSVEQRTPTGIKDMTFRGVERLRAQVAEDEGIERDVVIGEFGYDTTPGAWYHVPEPRRSEYLAEALRLTADWAWLEAFTPYSYVVGPDDGFRISGTPSETAIADVAGTLVE